MKEEIGSKVDAKWREAMAGAKEKAIKKGKKVFIKRAGRIYSELLEAGCSSSEALGLLYATGAGDMYKAVEKLNDIEDETFS